jgi:hypothetical protein
MWPVADGRDGNVASLGQLAAGASGRRAQVADRVPALDQDEPPLVVIAETDVR